MTLKEFIIRRLNEDEQVYASQLRTAQAAGPDGLYLYPGAHMYYESAKTHREVLTWVIERRLYGAPRIARVQTMKALAYLWRDHPDYDQNWSPS